MSLWPFLPVDEVIEVLEWNARPEDVKRLNDYYASRRDGDAA